MIKQSSAVFCVILGAAPVLAELPVPLWKDLLPGMSKQEVTALYPTGKTMLTPECEAQVVGRYKGGKLSLVALRMGDLMAAGRSQWEHALRCQAVIIASIKEKYGSTSNVRIVEPPEGPYKSLRSVTEVATFVNGSIKVELSVKRDGPFTAVTYERIPPRAAPTPPTAAPNL